MTRILIGRDRSTLTDELGRRLFEEAVGALPDPYGDKAEGFMPDKPRVGRCRICGAQRALTREHLPPAAAFNRGRSRVQTVEEWLTHRDEDVPGGAIKQGGLWAYTLCKPCNDITGARYGDEYRRWTGTILNSLAELGTNVRALEGERSTRRGHFSIMGSPDPRPGALVRQILSMMCSVSAGFDLAGRYPAIRRMILEGSTERLPAGMSIGVTVYLSSRSRISAPMMSLDTSRSMWRWTIEIAHAPLASLLVITSGGNAPAHVWDVSHYTEIGYEARMPVEGDLEIGFGNTLYPGDYRTSAAVTADST